MLFLPQCLETSAYLIIYNNRDRIVSVQRLTNTSMKQTKKKPQKWPTQRQRIDFIQSCKTNPVDKG